MSRICEDNSLSIGNTPLVRLDRITEGAGATVAVLPDSGERYLSTVLFEHIR